MPLAAAEAVALLPPAAQQWYSLRVAQQRLAPLLAETAMPCRPEEPERSDGAELDGVELDGVELDGVDARWPGAAEPALRGASVHVPADAHVAVVGPSGGGKSTLLAVLLGFLPPENGEVRGVRKVSWSPQEPGLVSTTIRENLRLAAPRDTDQELVKGLRLAGLPGWGDQLDEPVGSGGTALSGGEAARLALARALLKDDAETILLDEPTAHLDATTSEELLARLRQELPGKTLVHVTHRQAETEYADIVLRVEGGLVTEERGHARKERIPC